MLADQPGLFTGKMLLALVLDPLRGTIGDPFANSGKPRFQSAISSQPPTHIFPLGISKHVFRRHRRRIRDVYCLVFGGFVAIS